MDLLFGYGSDASDDEAPRPPPKVPVTAAPAPAPSAAAHAAPPTNRPARRSGLLSGLPPPQTSAAASLPSGFFDAVAAVDGDASGKPSRPRAVADDDARAPGPAALPPRPPAQPADLPASDSKLWAKLPEPAAAPTASRRRVAFQSPLLAKAALLGGGSDSDDDAGPAAKRARVAGAGAGVRHTLTSLLPAPKQEAPARGGGARLHTGGSSAASTAADAAAAGGDGGRAHASSLAGNEAFRVGVGGAAPPAPAYAADVYAVGTGGATYAAGDAYAYGPAQPPPPPQQQQQQRAARHPGPSVGDDADALLAAALAAEAARAAKRAGGGTGTAMAAQLQFKEVDGAALKHVDAAVREANEGLRAALGSDYAQRLRSEAAPFAGSKMAKRKHQIGTLFANAKLQELEILEQRAMGVKSKAETKGKYGW